jgi:hypothetical protein
MASSARPSVGRHSDRAAPERPRARRDPRLQRQHGRGLGRGGPAAGIQGRRALALPRERGSGLAGDKEGRTRGGEVVHDPSHAPGPRRSITDVHDPSSRRRRRCLAVNAAESRSCRPVAGASGSVTRAVPVSAKGASRRRAKPVSGSSASSTRSQPSAVVTAPPSPEPKRSPSPSWPSATSPLTRPMTSRLRGYGRNCRRPSPRSERGRSARFAPTNWRPGGRRLGTATTSSGQ